MTQDTSSSCHQLNRSLSSPRYFVIVLFLTCVCERVLINLLIYFILEVIIHTTLVFGLNLIQL